VTVAILDGEKEILLRAYGHPEGCAHVGHHTRWARALVKRGLAIWVGREAVQMTDAGVAEALRLKRGAEPGS
jgi:hypothetical protein